MKDSSLQNEKNLIVQDGDPVLRTVARPVTREEFDSKELTAILRTMSGALEKEYDGVAIAAPQIGVSMRIFVVSRKAFTLDEKGGSNRSEADTSAEPIPETNMVCINPEIIKVSRKKVKVPEGCLSVRWYYGNTLRNEKVILRAYDEHGKLFTYGGSGLIAQIFQHETDHLNGILFTDHATEIEELSAEEIAKIKEKSAEGHG